MTEWESVASFDDDMRGAFVAIYSDNSGARILYAADNGVYDGEDMLPVNDFDVANYSMFAFLPEDFEPWGMRLDG